MSDFLNILYEKKGRVAYVTINRPEVMNAINPPTYKELTAAWTDYMADDNVWVAIFTGAGERAFCAGADLKYRTEKADEQRLRRPTYSKGHILDRCWKPVIAAVNGYAVGGGLEMALHCDIIIAAEHAQFGLPEARRGLLADTGGAVKLPRRVPYHVAMGLLLTGKLISAREAYRIGLVNEVVLMAELLTTAERWASEILECAPLSVWAAKQVAKSTLGLPLDKAADSIEELEMVRRLRDSEDYIEGPKAFAEKRKPEWQGR